MFYIFVQNKANGMGYDLLEDLLVLNQVQDIFGLYHKRCRWIGVNQPAAKCNGVYPASTVDRAMCVLSTRASAVSGTQPKITRADSTRPSPAAQCIGSMPNSSRFKKSRFEPSNNSRMLPSRLALWYKPPMTVLFLDI
uniref:Uncharacterized protein n=1 Tax=Romanomermis culicivorax TaxID=13658 RepID=A0A915J7V3_ROMCU